MFLHCMVAMGTKMVRSWDGSVWDSEPASAAELLTYDAIAEKIAYELTTVLVKDWGFRSPSAPFAPNPRLYIWGFRSPSAPFAPNPDSRAPTPANRPTVFIGARKETTDGERGVLNGSAVCRVRLAIIRSLVFLDARGSSPFSCMVNEARIRETNEVI
jgi:hypothetical protein